jgi:PIN domain nuclease of toxin-antitoxin system
MRILIDTHILIWHLEDDARLSQEHSDLIEDAGNAIYVSVASLWEIAIKTSLGKLSLSRSISEIFAEVDSSATSLLAIEPSHTLQVSSLPFHHKDPFDRMIIAQALVEGLSLVSNDVNFADYGVDLL